MNSRFKINGKLDLLIQGYCAFSFLWNMRSLTFYDGPENFWCVVFTQSVHADIHRL